MPAILVYIVRVGLVSTIPLSPLGHKTELEEGYEVQVSADASASWSMLGNELALRRMENAGASDLPIILAELQ